METPTVIHFDPDFRRAVPKLVRDYCCVCQKEVKNMKTAVAVTIDWNTWTLLEGHGRASEMPNFSKWPKEIHDGHVGPDCWKKLKK